MVNGERIDALSEKLKLAYREGSEADPLFGSYAPVNENAGAAICGFANGYESESEWSTVIECVDGRRPTSYWSGAAMTRFVEFFSLDCLRSDLYLTKPCGNCRPAKNGTVSLPRCLCRSMPCGVPGCRGRNAEGSRSALVSGFPIFGSETLMLLNRKPPRPLAWSDW